MKIAYLQSLPSRQLHSRPGSPMNGVLEGRERLAGGETTGSSARLDLPQDRAPAGAREAGTQAAQLAACLALAMLSISCGKKEAPKPAVTEAPKPAAVSDAKIDAAIEQALTPPTPTKSDVQAGLEAQAEDILAKYPNKNAQDLLSVPEVNEALKVGLTKLSKDKKLQDQINQSVSLAAKMQGLSGAPGTVGLDLDLKGYDQERKSRMVQAVISEDPKQIVRFLTEEIGEAVPELTLGGADRASNGVKIKETPAPAAVPK